MLRLPMACDPVTGQGRRRTLARRRANLDVAGVQGRSGGGMQRGPAAYSRLILAARRRSNTMYVCVYLYLSIPIYI